MGGGNTLFKLVKKNNFVPVLTEATIHNISRVKAIHL